MEIKKMTLPIGSVELNSGQINGLPANPRQWTLTDVERLAASLKETPELLEMRCPIVVEHNGKYVTLGGNLRIAAARHNQESEVACFVIAGASTQKMKEIVIKDNGNFGKWDFDSLANEWDGEPLNDWGVEVWQPEDEEEKELPSVKPLADEWFLNIRFENEAQCHSWFDRLLKEGLECKIVQ